MKTVRLRNINPLGAVDVPILRRQGEPFGTEGLGCLEPGEVFDCPDDIAEGLLEQSANYERVTTAKKGA